MNGLSAGKPALLEHIRETMRRSGPLTFARFMEQALYHPADGYYSSGRCAIGRSGDYYTSVSVGPLFGRLLAAQFAEMWAALGRPDAFAIVEQGAHDGTLARDVLAAAERHYPDLSAAIRYEIIEPFSILQARQEATLSSFRETVTWHQSLAALPPFRGVHFSNELVDALPVHVVQWTGVEWLERHVTERDGGFVFVDLPLSSETLTARLRTVPMPLPAGYETEVNILALEWMAALSQKLMQGYILAVDYGFSREEFYAPERVTGTLRSFAQHRVLASPLREIGQADITAHVEWTSLAEQAEACGLAVAGFADQHHFITGLIAGEMGQEFGPAADAKTRRALQTLLHPQFLGLNFQFLAFSRDMDAAPALTGFRFARNARTALALH